LIGSVLAALALACVAGLALGAENAETQLRRVLSDVAAGRLHAALGEVDGLIGRYPNFRLAHLVRGDVLLAHARPIGELGNTGHAAERLEALRAEALARLQALREGPPAGAVPRQLLVLAPGETHAMVVDGRREGVYFFENNRGVPRVVADF
jgi:hypothetical protein